MSATGGGSVCRFICTKSTMHLVIMSSSYSRTDTIIKLCGERSPLPPSHGGRCAGAASAAALKCSPPLRSASSLASLGLIGSPSGSAGGLSNRRPPRTRPRLPRQACNCVLLGCCTAQRAEAAACTPDGADQPQPVLCSSLGVRAPLLSQICALQQPVCPQASSGCACERRRRRRRRPSSPAAVCHLRPPVLPFLQTCLALEPPWAHTSSPQVRHGTVEF